MCYGSLVFPPACVYMLYIWVYVSVYTCYTYEVYVRVYTCYTCGCMCVCVYKSYTCGVYVPVYVREYGGQGSASEQ